MRKIIKDHPQTVLLLSFLIFYTVQIPEYTWKNDIIVFSARSLQDLPVLNYAYLDSTTLLSENVLPNYHLGHTVFLWLFYQAVPSSFSNSIWPAGLLSAIAGSLTILLTYLICLQINLTKRTSLITAIIYGIIPSIWEHAVIGELYTLQMLFTLSFLYYFLKNRLFISALSFYAANLISPLSALAFTFFLLRGRDKKTIIQAILVALSALLLYILTYMIVGFDISALVGKVSEEMEGRGLTYRIMVLGIFITINFHFFLYYFFKGYWKLFIQRKELFLALSIGVLPQFLLLFISPGFFIEKGSFQIALFWAMTLPAGAAIAELRKPNTYLISSVVCSIVLAISLWIYPHYSIGSSLAEAGRQLKEKNYEHYSIIGAYGAVINILQHRNGLCLDSLNKYFYDYPMPHNNELIKTNKSELLIAHHKKTPLRKLVSNIGIRGLEIQNYNPGLIISEGTVYEVLDNDAVTIYKWVK